MQTRVKKEILNRSSKNSCTACGSELPFMIIPDRSIVHCCEVSKFKFLSEGSLSSLRGQCSAKSPYCDICGRQFPHKSGLKRHLAVHSGERPFICVTCGKGFKAKAALKRHEIIHTGEFPFECNICKKRFNQINNLRKHMVIHSNTCPFYCETCGKGFNQLSNLKKHHLAVHETPHDCGVQQKRRKRKLTFVSSNIGDKTEEGKHPVLTYVKSVQKE